MQCLNIVSQGNLLQIYVRFQGAAVFCFTAELYHIIFEPSWKPADITSLQVPYKRILAHVIFLLNCTFRCIAAVKYSHFNEHGFVE